ncbi:Copper amine oxidase N-terminal domain-containing protein [Gracilibacillus ureilyticus]|uniref:Copper amine oxidase N-terminal domain-containing protein n=1 Tax=Gracilibacillus ureilyticus TaxID=531814 RepID=A0A1H9S9A7_9BACI|nr:copper amine oxidase N-terminal domain-containing protein [Gracilibacillus ureilyticus]SER81582.1 Copper amine oxidase N-terminal domain-containing protein [Gracilibacillus ureilyticus]
MKKIKYIIIFSLVLFIAVPSLVFAADKAIKATLASYVQIVNVRENIDTSSNPLIIYNQRTYVPLRVVSEALGYEVGWDAENYRVDLKEEDQSVKLAKDGIEVIEYAATPNARVPIHDVVSVTYTDGEILYTITEPLKEKATATFQVINQNNKVIQTETIILEETEPGTYKHNFYTGYFRTSYDGTKGDSSYFQDKVLDEFSYRLKLN